MNGLVHPFPEKCESFNWRMVYAEQIGVQGLGPHIDQTPRCDFGDIAPYTSPKVMRSLESAQPFRVQGYPYVTPCSKLSPLLYNWRTDPNPPKKPADGRCECRPTAGWPYTFN